VYIMTVCIKYTLYSTIVVGKNWFKLILRFMVVYPIYVILFDLGIESNPMTLRKKAIIITIT